ncbi:MAG: hypothetical protein M1837_006655 [Sclerophora amabilis]|nr:MAG: hypothetical protein M1837_006655 [Sclerophora amabilis]
MTIIQPNMEVSILTNKITFTPSMPEYSSYTNPAPSVREILSNTFHSAPSTKIDNQDDSNPSRATTQSRLNGTNSRNRRNSTSSTLTGDADAENPQHDRENNNDNDEPLASALYPSLSPATQSALVNETIHALIAVGGHENPPARHIVGHEGVASVKEKLKTVSEELEDFVEVSGAVDIVKEEERPITGSQTATSGTGAGPNLTSLRGTD